MTTGAKYENGTNAGPDATRSERVAERICRLEATDEQYRNATPDPVLQAAAREPGLRLPQILEMFAQGYADRPALGWRARELTADPTTGRTTSRLLDRIDTISYRDLWANVRAVATAWRHDAANPVTPGDVV